MSRYGLCKAVHHLYIHRDVTLAARAGDFRALDGFDLAPDERTALERKDLVALYRLGVEHEWRRRIRAAAVFASPLLALSRSEERR